MDRATTMRAGPGGRQLWEQQIALPAHAKSGAALSGEKQKKP
jgi:hypothetical protein